MGLQILASPPRCSMALKLSNSLGCSVPGVGGSPVPKASLSPTRVICEQRPAKMTACWGHVRLGPHRDHRPSSPGLPAVSWPALGWPRDRSLCLEWSLQEGAGRLQSHLSPSHPCSAASYDKRIILWDIGVPNHDYEFQAR